MKGKCFTEPLFHKVIDGSIKQFREIIKPQPDDGGLWDDDRYPRSLDSTLTGWNGTVEETGESKEFKPRYKPGEKLYLKEPYFEYRELGLLDRNRAYKYSGDCLYGSYKWQNKLFMPAKYARYFIEITGVRCERLQNISNDDCMKEGIYEDYIERDFFHYYDPEDRYYCADCEETGRKRLIAEALEDRDSFGFDGLDDDMIKNMLNSYSCDDYDPHAKTCDICGKNLSVIRNGPEGKYYDYQSAYADLINKISSKGTWESNPFVWVYDFKLTNLK